MDTIQVVIKKDSLLTKGNWIIEKKTVETTIQDSHENCFETLCNCPLISDLIWPLLIITIVILFYRRLAVLLGNLANRIASGDNFSIGPSGISVERPTKLREEEIIEKAELELELQIGETDIEPVQYQKEYVSSYLEIEKRFINLLQSFFSDDFKVLTNVRFDPFEYDVILQAQKVDVIDYIFEIKYFPTGYNKSRIQDAVLRLSLAARHYINITRKSSKPLLVIVVKRGDFDTKEFEELDSFTRKTLKEFNRINILTVFFDEFDQITKENILQLMHKY